MIWECCKNCICNCCKNKETINYEIPEYYCENCDNCDLGDFSKDTCSGFINENDEQSFLKTHYVMPNEIRVVDGPYMVDLVKIFNNKNDT